VVNTYPHDRGAFTQGLVYAGGFLYEGTGLHERSSLREVRLESGEVLRRRELEDRFFGEGVTLFDGKIYQLTWQSHTCFVYDKETFELLGELDYPTEGWGLTHDGEHLILSDGTASLYFLEPDTFDFVGQLEVRDGQDPVVMLNELEYVKGEIYANIWKEDRIARISPRTGRVLGWIDVEGILSEEDREEPVDVLNGIAYDSGNDRLFVTGKLWPTLFEIELIPGG
jgi:glutamine cyclotransferase